MSWSFRPSKGVLALDGENLSVDQVVAVARHRQRVTVAPTALIRVARCRGMIEVLLGANEKVYGLTTGFGKLRDVAIAPADTRRLQENLIRSHAAGLGKPFAEDVVRAAILLRANTLCRGHSGVRVETLLRLVALLNDDVYPYVPQQGSVGASGDLAPLSHLALALIADAGGRYYPRSKRSGTEIVAEPRESDFVPFVPGTFESVAEIEGWRTFQPVVLEAKEGLALNNGTQIMTAVACLALHDAYFALRFSELAGAMSLEANRGVRGAYLPQIHQVRPQAHQGACAARIIAYCEGSQILDLYLNSGHLGRARVALDEAIEHLQAVEQALEQAARETPALVSDTVAAIRKVQKLVQQIIPDADWVRSMMALPPRAQIQALDRHLAAVRVSVLGVLRSVQERAFPALEARSRAESALVNALDQLKKAVPDAPIVQDDYSFRCFPQVLGGAYRALEHVAQIVEVEVNSATDNPLLFPYEPEGGFETLGVPMNAGYEVHQQAYQAWLTENEARIQACRERVIGGGNFHGQPVATATDYLAIAVAEVASISERRFAHLVDESLSRGLPPFLIAGSGLNSGFMIPQYSAASLVSENKVLCHPASVDSIPTCAGSEDHVSMGTIAARKCADVIENTRQVIALELLAAYQALGFRLPLLPGTPIQRVCSFLEAAGVTRWRDDRVMYEDMRRVAALLRDPNLMDLLF